jgi:hypothetical protein
MRAAEDAEEEDEGRRSMEEDEEEVDGAAEEVDDAGGDEEEEEMEVCMYSSWSSSTNGRSHSYATRRSPCAFSEIQVQLLLQKLMNTLSLVCTWQILCSIRRNEKRH